MVAYFGNDKSRESDESQGTIVQVYSKVERIYI